MNRHAVLTVLGPPGVSDGTMSSLVLLSLSAFLLSGCLSSGPGEQDLRNFAQVFYQTREGSNYGSSYDGKANALYLGEADSGTSPSESRYHYRITDGGGKCLFAVMNPRSPTSDGRPLELVMDLTKFSLGEAVINSGTSIFDVDRELRIPLREGAISQKIYNGDGTSALRDSGQPQARIIINLQSPSRDGFVRTMLERVRTLAAKCN